jgi:hypothetical protein
MLQILTLTTTLTTRAIFDTSLFSIQLLPRASFPSLRTPCPLCLHKRKLTNRIIRMKR